MIRNVRSQDAQALVHICKTALKHETDSVTLEQRIQELSQNEFYYIAVYEDDHDHRVLGFIQAERYNLLYAGNGWNIIALAVDPEAQRQGIGKKLLTALEKKSFRRTIYFYPLKLQYDPKRSTCVLSEHGIHL